MKEIMFNQMAYTGMQDFVYGTAKKPVTARNGLVIGGGEILPEINFTLPPMLITSETMPEVLSQYKGIVQEVCKRAKELYVPGFVVEVELLPPTTYNPQWGVDITKTVREVMNEYESKYGLKSALRMTPIDIREDRESVHMWKGRHWETLMQSFEGCAGAGADFLAIESIGGKDVHDDAVMFCEITKSLFALGVLGARDMVKLWDGIVDVAGRTGSIASGDTACGFGNTAMVLADRGYVPKIFAAVVRAITVVRSLVALERGAVGPHKDCGYEGVYIKAITGTPISLEGKSSAGAHLSPVGNIAAAVADLWSNESIQNIKLLGGMAPTVAMEQLAYDCRLMNTASKKGAEYAAILRDLLVESDSRFDPQAYILRPDVALRISEKLLKEEGHFKRTKAAALAAVDELRNALAEDRLVIEERETAYLDMMESQLNEIPDDEEKFVAEMVEETRNEKFDPKKYDM